MPLLGTLVTSRRFRLGDVRRAWLGTFVPLISPAQPVTTSAQAMCGS